MRGRRRASRRRLRVSRAAARETRRSAPAVYYRVTALELARGAALGAWNIALDRLRALARIIQVWGRLNRTRGRTRDGIRRILAALTRRLKRILRPITRSNHPSLPMVEMGYRHAMSYGLGRERWLRSVLYLPAMVSLPKHFRCSSRAAVFKWDGYRGPAKLYLVSQVNLTADSHRVQRTTPPDFLDHEFVQSWVEKLDDTITEIIGGDETESIRLDDRVTVAGRKKLKLPALYAAYTPWIRYILIGVAEVDFYPCSLYYKPIPRA